VATTRKTRTTPPKAAGAEDAGPVPAPKDAVAESAPGESEAPEAGSAPAGTDADATADAPPRPVLRRKAFLDLVTTRAGSRKSDTRAVTDAALAVIAEALGRGEDVALPPLGRIRVVKTRDGVRSRVLTLRLSQQTGDDPGDDAPGEAPGQEGLADTGDTG